MPDYIMILHFKQTSGFLNGWQHFGEIASTVFSVEIEHIPLDLSTIKLEIRSLRAGSVLKQPLPLYTRIRTHIYINAYICTCVNKH
jgi:hypothetical protein